MTSPRFWNVCVLGLARGGDAPRKFLIALENAETDDWLLEREFMRANHRGDKDVPHLSPLRLGRLTGKRPATTQPKTATAEGAASVELAAIVAPDRSSATG
jgi:hypothetical protein